MRSQIERSVNQMQRYVQELGVDGIDLVQEQGFGDDNMVTADLTSVQLYYLEYMRKLMPNLTITYTFPADNYKYSYSRRINFPFRDILKYGGQYIDYFHAYRATYEAIEEMTDELGVPKVISFLVPQHLVLTISYLVQNRLGAENWMQ